MKKRLWVENFHYQNAGRLSVGTTIYLVAEPNNPYDANAIALYANLGFLRRKVQVGYIPKARAKALKGKLLPTGTVVRTKVNEVYGDCKFEMTLND